MSSEKETVEENENQEEEEKEKVEEDEGNGDEEMEEGEKVKEDDDEEEEKSGKKGSGSEKKKSETVELASPRPTRERKTVERFTVDAAWGSAPKPLAIEKVYLDFVLSSYLNLFNWIM